MKPRFEPRDARVESLIKGAKELEERLEKAQPEYAQKEGATQGPSHFETQVGGGDSVRTAHYSTNNVVPEVEDVANKGTISENVNILDSAKGHYPTSESTLGSHEGGSDTRPEALAKRLGTDGEQHRMDVFAKSVEQLSRRLE